MQKIISIFSAIFVIAGLVFPMVSVNAANATFNNDSLDVRTLQIVNSTKDKGTFNWASTVSADAGEEVAFLVYYHNTSNATAQNTKVRINLPSGSASSKTISTNIWADNANSIYGSTTLNLSSSQSISFISGSVKWYPNQNSSVAQTLPSGQTGDEITSYGGLNIGNIAGGWSTQGYLTLKVKVSSDTTTVISAPSVSTNSATNIGTNSATLNSSVNPNNATSSAWFEYGTSSSSLSYSTSAQSLSAGTSSSSVTSSISNLSSNTTYYFRAVASNSAGTTYGSILSFTTSTTTIATTTTSAPSVTTYSASGITSSAATLNGIVNPNNASTSVWFEYGTSSSSLSYSTSTQNFSASSDSSSFAVILSSLSSNKTYYFRAVASNSLGVTRGSILSFKTAMTTVTTTSAPAVTTNSATNVDTTSATLNASINPNNVSTTIWFEYGTSSSSLAYTTSTQSIGSGSASVSGNASLSNLSSNTTYYFRAVASNSAGTTYGSILSFTTSTATITTTTTSAPSVTTYSASGITSTSATLNGIVNQNNASTSAWFEYGTSSSSLSYSTSTQSLSASTSSSSVTYSISNLSANTTYYFRAVASNSAGTTYGSTLSFTTAQVQTNASAPLVTANAATAITANSANLNSTINPNGSSTNVWYEYGLSSGSLTKKSSAKNMGSSASYDSATISVASLSSNTTYYFRPVAQNSSGTTYGAINNFVTGSSTAITTTTTTTSTSAATNLYLPFIEITQSVENLTLPNGNQSSNFANIGDRLKYSTALKNTGGVSGYNLNTIAQLPSTLKYIESSAGSSYNSVSGTVSWNTARLRPQETIILSYVVEVSGGLNSTIQMQSQVYIPVKRLDVFSNPVSTIVSLQRPVSLKFIVDRNEVKAGELLEYSIIIKNINNYDIKNVLISIGLPENTELQEADFSAASRSENSIIVDVGNISAGNEIIKTFSVKIDSGVKKGDILTAVALVNYQDVSGNIQPVVSSSVSSVVIGSVNLAASIFGGIASFSFIDWLTLFGILIFILVTSYTTRSIMKRVSARRQA